MSYILIAKCHECNVLDSISFPDQNDMIGITGNHNSDSNHACTVYKQLVYMHDYKLVESGRPEPIKHFPKNKPDTILPP